MQAENGMSASRVVPKRRGLVPLLFSLGVLWLAGWGYWQRDDSALSAETGLGYVLGIVGVSCMLLLLSYPLAKRIRTINQHIPVRHWFRLHMTLGILGPLAILFHCNFHMGSLNSSVALMCMLLVVFSGVIGRYFYSKVHLGLYGQKASSKALLLAARQEQQKLRTMLSGNRQMGSWVDSLYAALLPADPERVSVSAAVLAAPRRWFYLRRFHHETRGLGADASALWQSSKESLDSYMDTLRKLAQFKLFERLLSWWHVLHLPIFIMMLITAVVHVWAVHLY